MAPPKIAHHTTNVCHLKTWPSNVRSGRTCAKPTWEDARPQFPQNGTGSAWNLWASIAQSARSLSQKHAPRPRAEHVPGVSVARSSKDLGYMAASGASTLLVASKNSPELQVRSLCDGSAVPPALAPSKDVGLCGRGAAWAVDPKPASVSKT